jgi:hypothetical protein
VGGRARHCNVAPHTSRLAPRSTRSHWGSLNALDQRVPALPSTAEAAVKGLPVSTDDAVTGAFSAALAVPHSAARTGVTGTTSATSRANAAPSVIGALMADRPRRT